MTDSEQDFRQEQIRVLFGQLHLIYLADVIAGLFLFLILASSATSFVAYGWLTLLLISTAIRATLAKQFRPMDGETFDAKKTWKFLIFGASWSGLIWGNSWALLPANPSFLELAAISLWLAGMLAGAATTMTVIKEVFLGFALPASFIFIIYSFLQANEEYLVISGAFIMYLGFITPIAIRVGSDFNRTIKLQTKNQLLQDSLLLEASRLQAKEEELIDEKRQTQLLLTEKKSADEKLKSAAEDRLLLLDAIGEGIFGISTKGEITFINRPALEMLDMQENDLINQSALRLISSTSAQSTINAKAYAAITRCFQKGIPVLNNEGYLTNSAGMEFPIRFSCTPVLKNESVVGSVISFVDVSNQKEMEAMLLQSQKMEAIGRLTGGVSHDFNNLLTVIMGNLQFLKKRLSSDEKAQELAEKVMQAAKNGADLNNRLLSFSREQALKSDVFCVGELIIDMREFIDRLLGEDVVLKVDAQSNDYVVSIDKTQLQNAILNLGVNAKDAMPEGGTFTIKLGSCWLDSSFSRTEEGSGSNEFVEITFTDTGIGIPQSIQKQIFEPFFTTKDNSQGTGLGLSTVYGFVRQSGGSITLTSEEGKGASFTFFLPISDEKPEVSDDQQEITPSADNLSGFILVVEDDSNVREIAVHTLEDTGFKVISASTGAEGLALALANSDIELIFSDVIMPGGMNGVDMAEEVLKFRPDLPILLATGYTEQSIKDRLRKRENVVIISKPYDTHKLNSLVTNMISRNPVTPVDIDS